MGLEVPFLKLDFAAMVPLNILSIAFVALLLASAFFYAVLVIRMFFAMGQLKNGNDITQPPPSVSVLVSARNEESNLKFLLDSLLAQDYVGPWEVWIADDRSEDKTLEILESYAEKYGDKIHILKITEIPEGASPKKNAISQLVKVCSGDLLLLTDADCKLLPTWISGMVKEFEPGIDFVAGHSYLELSESAKPLLYMQAVETMSYRIAGTAGLALRLPLTSTGNNIAYRKSFFQSVEGFKNVSHIQSGDDDLLMQKAASNPYSMGYSVSPETFVTTQGKETLAELWEQRKRWASKTIYYTPRTIRVLGGIFIFFLCLTISPLFIFLDFNLLWAVLFTFAMKVGADILLFYRGLRVFNQEKLLKWFVPVELLHAPFTVFAVLFGVLGKFKWKN